MQSRSPDLPVLLITGSNGQVGFELRRSLAPLGQVIQFDRATCDLSKPDEIRRAVRAYSPNVIFNAAAYTDVDQAESNAELAHAINATAAGILAEEALRGRSLLVHYSTDYVFDGSKSGSYTEMDAPNPQSVYGKSKLAGEQAILASGAKALILRTCWVAGAHGNNFAKTVLRLARQRDVLRVVGDQSGTPTSAALIADVTAQIVARYWLSGNQDAFAAGIYHLAAAGDASWHGYATEILRYAAEHGVNLKAGPASVENIQSHEYPQRAPRPLNTRLNTTKLRQTFGIHLPDWRQGIHHLLDQILPE